jgi:hypothetical protein
MPIVLGKLVLIIGMTTVAAGIAVAVGTILAFVDEADRRASQRGAAKPEAAS